MKKSLRCAALLLALCTSINAFAQKEQIVKTGLNFGPLPAIAFDADKGFQVGAILNIYNYGDGSTYPNYMSKWNFNASYYTKGSQLYSVTYDNMDIFKGVRLSAAVSASIDKALDFYGFNGYKSYFDYDAIQNSTFKYTPFYRVARTTVLAKVDFIGHITKDLYWEAGYHFNYVKEGEINRTSINKGKDPEVAYPDDMPTLYEQYVKWGLLSEEEKDGGICSEIRLGVKYDTRDKEGAPTRGIWAEARIAAAPKFIGNNIGYGRYGLTWRQYFPVVDHDILTFAYRVNYQGTIGKNAPYYSLPYYDIIGEDCDKDGMGGYRTCRGILRDRVFGLDMANWNIELRWRFVQFGLWNQNIAFGLSAFTDGAMVTRGRDMDYKGDPDDTELRAEYENYMTAGGLRTAQVKEIPHTTLGLGLRFIMNENFIVAFEYGMPTSRFYKKTSPYYRQDGNGAFYINLNYLF